MTDLLIRNLPQSLRADLVRRAKKTGQSLSEEAKNLLRKGLSAEASAGDIGADRSTLDAIRSAFGSDLMRDHEHADMMGAINAARKGSDRPLPHSK